MNFLRDHLIFLSFQKLFIWLICSTLIAACASGKLTNDPQVTQQAKEFFFLFSPLSEAPT